MFIVIEGMDGCGKTSIAKKMVEYLESVKIKTVHTREPGGSKIAYEIREILLKPREEVVHTESEIMLFMASRIQNVNNTIKPALLDGKVVVAERYMDSTFAYQCGGGGFPRDCLTAIREATSLSMKPDLTILLNVSVETGLTRTAGRGAVDRIEQNEFDYFERVVDEFNRLAATDPDFYEVIDAEQSFDQVWEEIKNILNDRLGIMRC